MSQAVLEMRQINKAFGGVPALSDVDFTLRQGEIHALVGGNGAGKSTLMKIMTGVYALDSGEIYIDGKKELIADTDDANKNGISMIFQELSLIQTMTVAENIFLGSELRSGPFRNKQLMNAKAREIMNRLGIDIDPNTPVNQLSVGMSQMIEIAKALSKDAKILVLDEPTASLSNSETMQLFKIMRDLKAHGVSMVYISHRMNEILNIADHITILRDGKLVTSQAIGDVNLDKIIGYMIGGSSSQKRFEWVQREYDMEGEDLLTVDRLHINQKITDISFRLKKGEILGFAGLMGSGRTEILETLFGIRKMQDGKIVLDGKQIDNKSPSEAIKNKFALIPEDRRKQGLILQHSVKENTILPMIEKILYRRSCIIDNKVAENMVDRNIDQLNIVTSSNKKIISLLSGGNQQKVVIAKWLNTNPKIMMLDEPTAGVDIGAKSEIIGIIREFADQGNGVLFVSSELTELMAVCDRIIVLFDGKITNELARKDIKSEEELQYAIQTCNE